MYQAKVSSNNRYKEFSVSYNRNSVQYLILNKNETQKQLILTLPVKAILCYYKTPSLLSYIFTQKRKHISVTGNLVCYEEHELWHQTDPDSNYGFTT